MKSPLRIGILIDSLVVPQWIYKIISDIQSSSIAHLAVIIKNGNRVQPNGNAFQKLWNQRQYLLYNFYSRLDSIIFRIEPDAFKRIDLKNLIGDCPIIEVKPTQVKFSDYFQEEELAQIRSYNLDVALRFGFRILKGDVLKIAKYGIWSYHHGDNLVNRGGPPGFWEVMENHPVTGSILQILTEDLDAGKVIYRSYAPTHRYSVKRNKNNYYWKSTAFVMRKLKELYENDESALDGDPHASLYHPYSQRLYKNPTNAELFPQLLKFSVRAGYDKLKERLTDRQWFVAYRINPKGNGIDDTFYRFKKLIPPKDRFWADPFPAKEKDKYFIFVEEVLYKDRKGHISVIELNQDGTYREPVKVLEKECHLSYPFVFRWRDNYFMIPETSGNKTIELYRSVKFPFEWELESVLMQGLKAVDATLFESDGLWWMFVNIGAEGTLTAFDELHLFHAKSPLGPWQPHKRNPVKSDVRSARPAGQLFRWRNELYRPAQDCSSQYGHAIALNKIEKLDTASYAETQVSKILPAWDRNLTGTHTLNSNGGLTVIDGRVVKPRILI